MQKNYPVFVVRRQSRTGDEFYVSVFKNSKVVRVSRNGRKVFSTTFTLEGQKFIALNGGPHFKFTPAISFYVDCKTQQEVDRLWEKLSKGGEKQRCGWLKDKFGVSWQIIPSALGEMLQDKDAEKAERVMDAMLQMRKIDVKTLKRAYAQS
jgi:predicted 3-demethylubiquinone-9 3-methyltransferase (glyoxalase superfamily)